MATKNNYSKSIKFIDGLMDNTGEHKFPLVDARDIYVDDTHRLSNETPGSLGALEMIEADLATTYDASVSYIVGDYCLYDHQLYRCTTAGANHTPAASSSYWTATNVMAEAGSGVGNSIAAAFTTNKTYAVGDYVVYQRKLYRCTSAVETAGDWTGVTNWAEAILANDVADLKSALKATAKSNTGNTILYDITTGKRYNTSGAVDITSPETQSGWGCLAVPASAGDIFVITGTGGSSTYTLWAFIDSLGEKLSPYSSGNASESSLKIIAPDNTAYLIANFDLSNEHCLIGGATVSNRISDLAAGLEQTNKTFEMFGIADADVTNLTIGMTTGYAIRNKEGNRYNGDTTSSTNAAYCSIAVSTEEMYFVTTRAGGNYSAIAFYDSSTFDKTHYKGTNEYQASVTTLTGMLVTIPNGVTYMGINTVNYAEYPISVKKLVPLKMVDALYQAGYASQASVDEILANKSKFEICMKRGDPTVETGKYMDGRQVKTGTDSQALTDYFEMKSGDVFLLNFVYKITLFNTSKEYSSEITVSTLPNYSGSTRWNMWTASANGYVRFSLNNTTSPHWGAAIKLLSNAPYEIVNFGDSLFGNNQKPYDLTTYIQNATGMKSANCGFGGTRASTTTAEQYRPLCFPGIADAIAATITDPDHAWDDIDIDWAALYGDNVFMVNKEILVNIDWTKINLITAAYGTNDMNGVVPIDNDQNKLDTTTFKGGLRYGIEKILTAYPQITIVLLSPLYRYRAVGAEDNPPDYSEIAYDSDTGNNGTWIMAPYVEAMQEVAEEYHLPFFDNYNSVGLNKFTAPSWLRDGTHLNYTIGPLKIGTKVGEEIASVFNKNRPVD